MKVLISGGSGLIGRAISSNLQEKGHQVAILSRRPSQLEQDIPSFQWEPQKEYMDPLALEGVDAIVNLAGSTIAQRWTPHGKNEILRSRVDATRTIAKALEAQNHQVKTLINASAVGYYPNSFEQSFTEEDAPGNDFLSIVCQKWEQEAMHIEATGLRVLRMRIGIVLDKNEGALAKMALPVKFGIGAPLGSGNQWMPWIHIEDLAAMFVFALENEALPTGPYNAVGPSPCTNTELTKTLAKVLKRPLFLPKVPEFALKLILGEMAATALASNKALSQKIESHGFQYRYNRLEDALGALYLD